MVPLGIARHGAPDSSGPVMVMRYNMYPSAAIHADAGRRHQFRPGASRRMEAVANERTAANDGAPSGPNWPSCRLQTGNTAMWVFVLAVVLVFLVLAAQYESWALPLAVILVVPMCLLCSIAGVRLGADGHQHLHADRLRGAGRPGVQERHPHRRVRQGAARGRHAAFEATLEACQLRLRPIIMTSFAFILGVVPLMLGQRAAPRCGGRWARRCSAACSA